MLGLYFHVPFCVRKCPYCDFYSTKYAPELELSYVESIVRDINHYGSICKDTVDSIYFGGGTPSLLSSKSYEKIFSAIHNSFKVSSNVESSFEANPATISHEKLCDLHRVGLNRISIGVQSLDNSELKVLGRLHDSETALQTVELSQEAGFNNISCDLMLGIVGQNLDTLTKSINALISTNIQHISAYMLKIEPNTPYNHKSILSRLPDEDLTSDLYLLTCELLNKNGLQQYEISNFAQKGFECRHNLKYWLCEEYIGIGPSAHSCFDGKRFAVNENLREFVDSTVQKTYVTEQNPYTFEEKAMLSLRLTRGLNLGQIADKQEFLNKSQIYVNAGLMKLNGNYLSFTADGFLLSNEIITRLIY